MKNPTTTMMRLQRVKHSKTHRHLSRHFRFLKEQTQIDTERITANREKGSEQNTPPSPEVPSIPQKSETLASFQHFGVPEASCRSREYLHTRQRSCRPCSCTHAHICCQYAHSYGAVAFSIHSCTTREPLKVWTRTHVRALT